MDLRVSHALVSLFSSDLCTECIHLLHPSCSVGVYSGIAGVCVYIYTPAIYSGIYLYKLNLTDTGDVGFLI